MRIQREEPGESVELGAADGGTIRIGRPGSDPVVTGPGGLAVAGPDLRVLDLVGRRVPGREGHWEVALSLEVEPRTGVRQGPLLVPLATGHGWMRPEADAFVAACEALARLGHSGDNVRTHGHDRLRFPRPPAMPRTPPPPVIGVKEYELPAAVQRAVAAGSRSVPGAGTFLPDVPPDSSTPGGLIASLVWPLVVAMGALPGLFVLSDWLPKYQAHPDAFLQTAEGMGGSFMLGIAGLMVVAGLIGLARQAQRHGKSAAEAVTGRAAEGLYLLDDTLAVKQPMGCTAVPRARLCGVAMRQVLPPFGRSAPAIAYLDDRDRVSLLFYESAHHLGKEGVPAERERQLVLEIERYIQAWRKASALST